VNAAVLDYYGSKGKWPQDQQGAAGDLTAENEGSDGPYMQKWPSGPWADSEFHWKASDHTITVTNMPEAARSKVIADFGGKQAGSDYEYIVK